MTFDLFSIELHTHSESYINLFCVGGRYKTRSLFYIQWTYERKLAKLQVLFIQVLS